MGLGIRWTIESDQTAIKETIQSTLNISDPCTIKNLALGAYNKLYIISSADEGVVARVTLPVEPKWKTLSEVATLGWVCEKTSLSVLQVFTYKADRDTAIEFEWVVTERVLGRSWADIWRDVEFDVKEEVVHQNAHFCSDLFQKQERGIGNLFPDSTVSESFCSRSEKEKKAPGLDDCLATREWMSPRLDLIELDCRRRLSLLQRPQTPGEDKKDNQHAVWNSNTIQDKGSVKPNRTLTITRTRTKTK